VEATRKREMVKVSKEKKGSRGLSERQRMFCKEYMIDLNATAAYIRAGYSPNGAKVSASNLLTNTNVIDCLNELMTERSIRTQINADYVLTNIKEIGERCMQKSPLNEYSQEKKGYIPIMDEEGRSVWQFDASNALKAQEMLGKHLRLFTDRVEIELGDSLAEDIRKARERVLNVDTKKD
jgi:phage terminase small subunit